MLFKNDELFHASDHITGITTGGTSAGALATGALKSFLPELEPNKVYHYVNKARWSMHDMVKYFLQVTGPAEVWITTWSISTGPASFLIDLVKAGMITRLSAIISSRIKINCPEALQILSLNHTRISLAELHAKILVIKNNTWSITIVGSQNWSKIKRIEAGVIDTSNSAAESHIQWIEHELINKPF